MRKALSHGIRMQNNLQTREDNFWIFMELYVSKAQLALPHGNFINGVANPEIVCQSHVLPLSTQQMSSSFVNQEIFWRKSRKLKVRGSPRFPCITPVKKSSSSELLQAIISHWAAGSHLQSCQTSCRTSLIELFCKKSKRP